MSSGVVTRIARLGIVIVVGAILAIATSGEAAAKHRKGHLNYTHAHRSIAESHAQLLLQQPARIDGMRYYGGPKSSMWHGSVEN
jgi:hypothetical protein